MPEETKDEINSIDSQAGFIGKPLTVFMFMLVALVATVSYFQYQINLREESFKQIQHDADEAYKQRQHDADEGFSYRYADMKSRYAQMKAICDDNFKNHASTDIWIRQAGRQAPPDLVSQKPCIVVVEKEN